MTRAALLLVALGVLPGSLGGQEFQRPEGPTVRRVALLGLTNVAIVTGVTTFRALVSGDPEWRSRAGAGALGGTIHFGGKTLAARSGAPAGILGRYTAAVGSSMAGNAMQGRAATGCIVLPAGPIWLNLSECGRPRLTVDLPTLAGALVGLSEGSLDVERSLETGALVFRGSPRDGPASVGWALGGALFYNASVMGLSSEEHRVRHELTHVIQHDMAVLAFSRPLEDRLARWLAPEESALKRMDLGLYVPLGLFLDRTPLRALDRLEREARILDGTGR